MSQFETADKSSRPTPRMSSSTTEATTTFTWPESASKIDLSTSGSSALKTPIINVSVRIDPMVPRYGWTKAKARRMLPWGWAVFEVYSLGIVCTS